MDKKVWKIKGYEGKFSDEQLVSLLKSARLTGEDSITSKDLKTFIKIKNSIYAYYLKEDKK